MFTTAIEIIDEHTHHHRLLRAGQPLSVVDALHLWQQDRSFRDHFIACLGQSPFPAFRWETPAVSKRTWGRPCDFVLLNAPHLLKKADDETFADYFTNSNASHGIVAFENLGKDATLLVPSPRTNNEAYPHLAAFMRGGPDEQRHALFQMLGQIVLEKILDGPAERPLWISTAGGGVSWLHVRIAHSPKYYGYVPYKTFEAS